MSMGTALWRPSAERIANANLTRFIQAVNAKHGLSISDYPQLYDWSIREPAAFWRAFAAFAEVHAEWAHGKLDEAPVLENGDRMPGAVWFKGTQLNFARNLLRHRDERKALIFRNDRGTRRTFTHMQLHAEVARVVAGLKAAGVVKGDRVAGYLPNLPEAVIAMLAATSLGAIWSSCSPDFGVPALLDRFGQIAPKVLFAADGYFYGGKTVDSLPALANIVAKLTSLTKVVVVPYVREAPPLEGIDKAVRFDQFGNAQPFLDFVLTDFDHPLYILYSSGTTGVPKCIVHGVGGTLLQHQKEQLLHTDLKREDVLFYFTTCGWMMWNWLASGLATGATLLLYEGSPFHPDAGALWRMAAEERVTVFGTSAKYLSALEKSDFKPGREVDLSAVRTILSTGSPLAPEGFEAVYRDIKADVQLSSISGGTDIVSCFALGCPILPVHAGEIQCRGLGMKVEIVDEQANPLRGEKGELVCKAPFPSMPIGFWNDSDGKRYHAAYFERFPNIWHHGDYAMLTEHEGVVIFGRSDAVLNPGGVRIGTAEIYSAVESLDEVLESLAVGQDWKNDVRVVLFVRLKPGVTLDVELIKKIRDVIRSHTTARHVPARVISVPDLPRTLSGKITELAVRAIIHGQPVRNQDALANPQALEYFRDIPELQS
jgi:acetoacetyl-CoA synthetase